MPYTADDYDAIRVAIGKLRTDATRHLICLRSQGGLLMNCWCYRGFDGTTSLPCPSHLKPEPEHKPVEPPPFQFPGLTPVPWHKKEKHNA